jgi:hypothetical protein
MVSYSSLVEAMSCGNSWVSTSCRRSKIAPICPSSSIVLGFISFPIADRLYFPLERPALLARQLGGLAMQQHNRCNPVRALNAVSRGAARRQGCAPAGDGTMRIPTKARNALLVVSALAASISVSATGGFALVALFGLSASAEEALNAESAAPDRDIFTMVFDDDRVQPILGKEVRSTNGEQMGQIVNVIIDESGRPRAAIIDFGGFLGVGSRKIVVDWRAFQFNSDNGLISLALTRDQVKAAPEYRDGKPIVVIGPIRRGRHVIWPPSRLRR